LFDLEVQSKNVPDEFARRGLKARPQTLLDKGGRVPHHSDRVATASSLRLTGYDKACHLQISVSPPNFWLKGAGLARFLPITTSHETDIAPPALVESRNVHVSLTMVVVGQDWHFAMLPASAP
jgi:hypothetical protein